MYSARFASTGANILVDLDAASDQAGMLAGEYFPCAELLDFADVATAECVWVDATQISAEVNNALTFVPGESVTLRAQTTMLACDDDRCECRVLNDASSVAVAPPDPLPDVQPVFQGPDAVAVCEEGGLVVDASPSTGSDDHGAPRPATAAAPARLPPPRACDHASMPLSSLRRSSSSLCSSSRKVPRPISSSAPTRRWRTRRATRGPRSPSRAPTPVTRSAPEICP